MKYTTIIFIHLIFIKIYYQQLSNKKNKLKKEFSPDIAWFLATYKEGQRLPSQFPVKSDNVSKP